MSEESFNNDEENNVDFISEDMFKEEDLMSTLSPGPRIFTLNNGRVTTVIGFVLEETEDSFLVALPSRMVVEETEENGKTKTAKVIESFVDFPYMRLLKNSVMSVIPIFGEFKERFDDYLSNEGIGLYPPITELIELYLDSDSEDEVGEEIPPNQEDEELQKKLEKIASMGGILPDRNDSKH